MIDVGPTKNGSWHAAVHVSAASIGAIASVIGIFIYAIGFISGYLVLRDSVLSLQTGNAETKIIVQDISERLTKLEDKVDYTAQGIADLKALKAGINR